MTYTTHILKYPRKTGENQISKIIRGDVSGFCLSFYSDLFFHQASVESELRCSDPEKEMTNIYKKIKFIDITGVNSVKLH